MSQKKKPETDGPKRKIRLDRIKKLGHKIPKSDRI